MKLFDILDEQAPGGLSGGVEVFFGEGTKLAGPVYSRVFPGGFLRVFPRDHARACGLFHRQSRKLVWRDQPIHHGSIDGVSHKERPFVPVLRVEIDDRRQGVESGKRSGHHTIQC